MNGCNKFFILFTFSVPLVFSIDKSQKWNPTFFRNGGSMKFDVKCCALSHFYVETVAQYQLYTNSELTQDGATGLSYRNVN